MTRETAITYEEELKKNPELKESDIQMLREWCEKQPHLPKISDVQLVLFLHSNYFRMEPTKNTIEAYFTIRTHVPELFSNRDFVVSKELRIASKTICYTVLETVTSEGYNISYAKLIDSDPSHYNFNYCVKFTNMYVDLWLHNEATRPGHVFILNMQGTTVGHISRISPMALKKFLFYVQEALPVRLMAIHFINTVPVMDIVVGMMKPFLKKELIEMMHFHSTTETLAKFIPLDALPNDDGGKGGHMVDIAANGIKWLKDNRAWFQTDEATMRVNESLRPGKGKTSTDLFGVEGSFKQLEID